MQLKAEKNYCLSAYPINNNWEKFLTFIVAMKKVHITREQRYAISFMYKQGCTQKFIAETVGKDKSVISRELKRNVNIKTGKYFRLRTGHGGNA